MGGVPSRVLSELRAVRPGIWSGCPVDRVSAVEDPTLHYMVKHGLIVWLEAGGYDITPRGRLALTHSQSQ